MKLKVIFVLLFFILYFIPALPAGRFFVSPVSAQFPPQNAHPVPGTNYLNTNPDVPQNFSTYTQSVFIEIAAALSCQIAGINPVSQNSKCLGVDQKTGRIGFVENGGGLIGIAGNMISMTFEIPISSTHYAKYLADNFGVAKKTYAVLEDGSEGGGGGSPAPSGGIGFNGLKPLLALWKTFRNMVYLFFVFIFIIIGLGIMFRVKIDPRTVMTIQNQIPKIVIALILVTFSYAIAGFLIDLMYVMLYLVFNVFAPHIGGIENLNPTKIQGSNPLSAVGFLGGIKMAANAAWGLGGIIGSLFDGTIGKIIATVVGALIGAGAGIAIPGVGLVAGGVMSIFGAGLGFLASDKIFGVIGGLIAFVVLGAAILSALFRLWFQLLKSYVFILINTVMAPFWIAGGLIPGSTINFGAWIRDLLANLAAFPATLAMLLFGKIFIDSFGTSPSPDNFAPPFIGNPGNQSAFGALIGVGIILLTPQVVNLVRQMIKAPEMKITTSVGQSIAGGAGTIGGTIRTTAGAGFVAAKGTMPPQGGESAITSILRRFLR